MRYRCILCGTIAAPETSLHQFPNDIKRKDQWMDILGLEEKNLGTNSRICQYHFSKSQYCNRNMIKLKRNALPTKPGSFNQHRVSVPSIPSLYYTVPASIPSAPRSKPCEIRSKDLTTIQASTVGDINKINETLPPPLSLLSPAPLLLLNVAVSSPALVLVPSPTPSASLRNCHTPILPKPNSSDTIQMPMPSSVQLSPPPSPNINHQEIDKSPLKELRRKLKCSRAEVARLKKRIYKQKTPLEVLEDTFKQSPKLLHLIRTQYDRLRQSPSTKYDDTLKAIAHSILCEGGANAYRTIKAMGLLLPSIETLSRWKRKLN